jgi:MoaA/NifB/PqqE/SkfB family radical SAM enzyme
MPENIHWEELCNTLAPDAREILVGRVLEAKGEMARICLQEGIEGKPAPLRFLSTFWNARPSLHEKDIRAAFNHYLEQVQEKESTLSYILLLNQVAEQLDHNLGATLAPRTYEQVKEIGISEILSAPGAPDPMGSALKQMLAGLPPVEKTAVTNVGLPKAEDHHNKFKGHFCPLPFDFAQIDPLGQMYLCCPQTLPEPVGNLSEMEFMEAWNSEKALAVRSSILDGSFRYCSETTCGVLQSRSLPKTVEIQDSRHREIIDKQLTHIEDGPLTVNMSYDRSCNLSCPSCRKEMVVLKGKSRERAEVIHQRVINGAVPNAERLIITGSGDPFGSKLFFSFLREFDPTAYPKLKISLSSNGLLFTPKTWDSICNEAIDRVDISVDAAEPMAYLLNRGGDYEVLVENLHFIGDLRRSGKIGSFELHFVVQANNFRQMKDFVQLGLDVAADHICFKQIVNWGTFSEEQYLSRAVQLSSHPLHEEFTGLLNDPVFRIDKVYMHDLYHLTGGVPA